MAINLPVDYLTGTCNCGGMVRGTAPEVHAWLAGHRATPWCGQVRVRGPRGELITGPREERGDVPPG